MDVQNQELWISLTGVIDKVDGTHARDKYLINFISEHNFPYDELHCAQESPSFDSWAMTKGEGGDDGKEEKKIEIGDGGFF